MKYIVIAFGHITHLNSYALIFHHAILVWKTPVMCQQRWILIDIHKISDKMEVHTWFYK